jgi:shikimate kinase
LLIKAKDPTCKKSDAEMKEFIAVHLWKKFYYNQAQYKVAVDGKTSRQFWILLQF